MTEQNITPTTVVIRDTALEEDLVLHMTDETTAEAIVEKVVSSAETGEAVEMWKGATPITFTDPDVLMGPTAGFAELNVNAIFGN